MDSRKIITQWLNELAYSAATWNLEEHMALVSQEVTVLGIPGVESVDFNGWRQRRRNEFDKKLLHSLSHRKITLLSESPRAISFSVYEQMRDSKKKCIEVGKEVTLQLEGDGKWRVVREQLVSINASGHCPIN